MPSVASCRPAAGQLQAALMVLAELFHMFRAWALTTLTAEAWAEVSHMVEIRVPGQQVAKYKVS